MWLIRLSRSTFGASSQLFSKMVDLSSFVRDIPDYPKPGILFRDITPLLADPVAIKTAAEKLAEPFLDEEVDLVAAAEARGFIFAASLAIQLGAGFVPIRKPGKLPFDLHSFAYELEYGTDELQVHVDGVKPGQRVLIVDDLLATGGTMEACCRLLEKSEAEIIGCTFLIHLVQLGGEERLSPYRVHSVLRYDQDDHEVELSP
jgi:adenine phosphoribosyltransferase